MLKTVNRVSKNQNQKHTIMKTKIIKCIAALFCFVTMLTTVKAQTTFSIGANTGICDLLGSSDITSGLNSTIAPAIGLRAQLGLSQKVSLQLGWNHAFISTGVSGLSASANDIYLHGLYDIAGTNNEGFGFYIYLGLGYLMNSESDAGQSQSSSTISIEPGLGAEYEVASPIFIFLEVGPDFSLEPATDNYVTANPNSNPVFSMFDVKLGVRISFGGSK
jgi:hypothetical protein